MYFYIDISQYKRHALCLGRVDQRLQIYRSSYLSFFELLLSLSHIYKSMYCYFFCRNIEFGMKYAIVETHNMNVDISNKGMYEC